MTDPIADMLIRIKNAQAVGHETARFPFSKLKLTLAEILEREGYLAKVERRGKEPQRYIKIGLKYKNSQPAIRGLKRISRPGQRIYSGWLDIKPVKQGHGSAIISTSKGLMTDKEARKERLGGEILCEIW